MNRSTHLLINDLLGSDFRVTRAVVGKPPYTLRILAVGDSYTYGLGVSTQQAFPSQLQELLNKRHSPPFFEVINAGRPGLNVYSEWALTRQLSDSVDFDLLLICLSNDDACPWSRQELVGSSHDVETIWNNQMLPESLWRPFFKTALDGLALDLQQAGRGFLVAYFEPHGSLEKKEFVAGVCKELNLTFIDLVTPFERFSSDELKVSPIDSHPNQFANRVAAVEIAEAVTARSKLEWQMSVQQLEAGMIKGAKELIEVNSVQEFGLALPLLHLRSLMPYVSGIKTESLIAADSLRHEWNLYYRLVYFNYLLRSSRSRIGELNECLYKLERLLLLSDIGVEAIQNEYDSQTTLEDLARISSDCLLKLERWNEDITAEERQESGSNPLGELIRKLSRDLHAQMQLGAIHKKSICDALMNMFRNAQNLARRHRNCAKPQERYSLCDETIRQMNSLIARLSEAADFFDEEGFTELVVDVKVPGNANAQHITLISTYAVLYPFTRLYRQCHYVIADGDCRAYRFDVPEGTIGYITVELKVIDSSGAVSVSAGEDYIKNLFLEIGSSRRAYSPGAILMSSIRGAGKP